MQATLMPRSGRCAKTGNHSTGPGSRVRSHILKGMRLVFSLATVAPGILGGVVSVNDARANEDCVAVVGIGASIDRFLGEVGAAQMAGEGQMPIEDVLFGVTEVSVADQQDLAEREAVQLTKDNAGGGTYVSRGPRRITVEGVFAGRDTVFRIPKLVTGRYAISDQGVTLIYDRAHTVEVGERVLGIKFFRDMNHTIVTEAGLSFFFDSNTGDEADRCYVVVRD